MCRGFCIRKGVYVEVYIWPSVTGGLGQSVSQSVVQSVSQSVSQSGGNV